MSFLDKVKAGTNTGANNPFGGGVNAFGAATTTPATKPATPTTPSFAKPGILSGVPAPGAKPGMPTGAPKVNPGFIAAAPGAVSKTTTLADGPKEEVKAESKVKTKKEEPNVEVKAETKEETKAPVEEKTEVTTKEETAVETKQVTAEELINDIDNTTIEEPKEEVNKAPKKKTSRSRNSKSNKKKAEENTKEVKEVVDSPETVEMVEKLFKIPTTTISYSEATKAVRNRFVDEEWDKFREELIAASDEIVVESDMTEGALKKTGAALTALRERVWVHFCDTKVLLEELSNKDTEGIIERIKYANLEGANETARKKAGVLAVMNYKDESGNTINLYEVYDETKSRFLFLKGIMDTIKYKSDILITMSAGIKMEKKQF